MRRDWKTIVHELTDYGIPTAIITNGFLFSEETIRDQYAESGKRDAPR